jgi:hypothetical protein
MERLSQSSKRVGPLRDDMQRSTGKFFPFILRPETLPYLVLAGESLVRVSMSTLAIRTPVRIMANTSAISLFVTVSIVVAPSPHVSDKQYRWRNCAPIADAPEWFL